MSRGESKKRSFDKIRTNILLNLSKGQKTLNQISKETGINWKTVDNHIVYLVGRGLVTEVFKSSFVRIYELSEEGKEFLLKKFQKKLKIIDSKIKTKIGGSSLQLLMKL
tara:strand:- start:5550 stop:5876 length:327 start_codon:yes stop_codon:yes gene_type:complete